MKSKLSLKKYQSMSQMMNSQLNLQKVIYNKSAVGNMLTRYGGKMYRSQSKNLTDDGSLTKEAKCSSPVMKKLKHQ